MGLLPSDDVRNLKWSDFNGLMKVLMVLMLAEVIVMGTGLTLGVDMDRTRGIIPLGRALLGQEDVTSEAWLWVARLMVVLIVITIVWLRRESERVVADRARSRGSEYVDSRA